jgi:hypothetical protein
MLQDKFSIFSIYVILDKFKELKNDKKIYYKVILIFIQNYIKVLNFNK